MQKLSALIELDDALIRMAKVVRPIGESESCHLTACLGRVTSEAIIAPQTLPAFDSSAVDGYAFDYADGIANQSFTLLVIGQSLAGHSFAGKLSAGTAVRIATGAVVPDGADTIVMQEQCDVDGGQLIVKQRPEQGACIRKAGGDFTRGDHVVSNGRRLQPQDIALIGALGITDIKVQRRIKIAIFSTGAELRPAGSKLEAGQIADTNGLMLTQLLSNYAVDATLMPPLPDAYDATVTALQNAAKIYDVIITSGGVSVGSHDFVRDVIHELGTIHFWRLAIRPGKPVLFGQMGDCLMACLPGNPVSAMVTFFLIVAPLLEALSGDQAVLPPAFNVPIAKDFIKDSHLRTFSRARLERHEDQWRAMPYHDQGSNLIGSLTGANGLLDLPIGVAAMAENDMVAFRPFTGLFI